MIIFHLFSIRIYQLEKELYYYKKTSRDLKKKLRIFENKLANKSGKYIEGIVFHLLNIAVLYLVGILSVKNEPL